jgi:pyruvate dehydrogenase E2 component (dihydrolipoamide acetyltransferase)
MSPITSAPFPSRSPVVESLALPLPPGSRRQQPSRLQQLIARRMADAKATVPHFQVQTEVVMDEAIALRAELKSLAGESDPVPSFNDMIIKAAAVALVEHPLANGSYQDDGFVLHDQVNVGMAVAADNALVVPTVFDAVGKSLGQIARETRALAARVRDGEISPAELEGGTFTVSNLGMFGMTAITPVINPPQAAILGVGALRQTLARVDGEIIDRTLLTLTLSCDHRILYGADASRFLARIRELLESPLRLAL